MKQLYIVALLLLTTAICAGQTQTEMNASSARDFQKADTKLNTVYQQILEDYKSDTAFIRRLKISQRLWVQLRDAEMKMKYPEPYTYGSMEPMCWYSYKTQLTKERIQHLKQWEDGAEEGDACTGSQKLNQ